MTITYLQLIPESALPDLSYLKPFRSIVVIEENVSQDWQNLVSMWLVESGCLYMMAWGNGCSSWDDSVDMANLKKFNFEYIPEDQFVMTTWHENELLSEVFYFAKNCAVHPTITIANVLILHFSPENKERAYLSEYEMA